MTFRHPITSPTTTPRRLGAPSCEASRRESLAHFPGARTTRRETWHDGFPAVLIDVPAAVPLDVPLDIPVDGGPADGGDRARTRTHTEI